MYRYLALALFAALIACCAGMVPASYAGATSADAVTGHWFTKDDKSVVEIFQCGETFCLKIVWLKEPLEDDGSPKIDKNNPDPSLRNVPIVGLVIGSGFQYADGVWKNGSIYDPDNGKTYSCKLSLDGDTLNVRGYIGVSLFGRTEQWKRKD